MFRSGEYLTFHFSSEGVEHLVPLSLLKESRKIHHLIDHENQVHIKHIASSSFDHLTTYLTGNHEKLSKEKITQMIEAAEFLGLKETVKDLSILLRSHLPPKAQE